MRAVLVLVLASVLPGCLEEHCGPTFSRLEASVEVHFQATPENRTRIREALGAQGFAVDHQYTTVNTDLLRLVRGAASLSVQPLHGGQLSTVRFVVDVEDREFTDGEPMDAYSKALEQRHQGEWDDVHARLMAAVGVPARPAPPLQGVAHVC